MSLGLILFYVVLVLIRPQEYMQGMEQAPILSSVFIVTFVLWFISVKKDFSVPQPLLMTSFVVVAAISVAATGWTGGAFVALQNLLPGWGLFIMLSMTANSLSRVRLVLDVIAFCAFVIALHSIEQWATGYGWTGLQIRPHDGRVHYLGIFNDPNDLGSLLVTVVPVMIQWLGREKAGAVRVVYFVMMLAVLFAIYLTDSRGALLAVGVVLFLETGKRYGVAKGAIAAMALVVVAVGHTRFSEIDVNEASAAGRIDAWFQGFEMFKSNPLLGVGYHNFTEYHDHTAHNSFVLVLAETGIVGFYFWLSIVLMTFIILINFLRKTPDELGIKKDTRDYAEWEQYQAIVWTYLVLLFGYITAISFLSRSYDTYFNIVFGLGSGLCLAVQTRYKAMPEIRVVDRMGGWAVSAFGGVIVTYLVIKILLKLQA